MIVITEAVIQEFKNFEKEEKKLRLLRYYGVHKLANAYLGLPAWFPIDYLCYIEHGISYQLTKLGPRVELSEGEILLLNNQVRKNRALQLNKKNVFNLGALFVLYQQMKGIQQDKDAKGTVCFPAHSIMTVSTEFDWDNYAQQLSQLPEEYQPIAACIYWKDVLKGRHKFFEKYNIPTYTNGHPGDNNYAHNFYQLVKQFKYTTSNCLGSYCSYALEMNIPFFLYGEKSSFSPQGDKRDSDIGMAIVNEVVESDFFINMSRSFELTTESLEQQAPQITAEQLHFHHQIIDKDKWESPSKIRRTILLKWPILLGRKIWKYLLRRG